MYKNMNITYKTLWTMACICKLSIVEASIGEHVSSQHVFDNSFLYSENAEKIDLDVYDVSNQIPDGKHRVGVFVNGNYLHDTDVNFVSTSMKQRMYLTAEQVKNIGIDISLLNVNGGNQAGVNISDIIPGATQKFRSENQSIYYEIPQKYLSKDLEGVSAAEWQDGVTAAFADYSINSYKVENDTRSYTSNYVGLNTGVNLLGWYFRHNGSLVSQSNTKEEEMHYTGINSYIQHDLTNLNGRFLLGRSNTSGQVFDTLPFLGVSIYSDSQMLPISKRQYMPEIRGVAYTNARVTVEQGGSIIYQTTVPSGEFTITDLLPSGYGSDLVVSVYEANGQIHSFSVPYSALTNLLHPKVSEYELTVGKYDGKYIKKGYNYNPSSYDSSKLIQGVWQHGVANNWTFYNGGQLSDHYINILQGSSFDTPLGGVSFDISHSKTDVGKRPLHGESYRISYNKYINSTNSNISLAAYRFSTKGYLDFSEAIGFLNAYHEHEWTGYTYRLKDRVTASISQALGDDGNFGQLYVNSIIQNSWNNANTDIQYQLGYSNRIGNLGYSLSVNRSKLTSSGRFNDTYMLSFQIPLGREPMNVYSDISGDSYGNYSKHIGISNSNQITSWSISGMNDNKNNSSGNAAITYRSPLTMMGMTASIGHNNRTISGSLNGAIVTHPAGITLTPYQSDTFAIVSAEGGAGADIEEFPALKLDHWGNAAVPIWSPYQKNKVSINPENIPTNVEIDSSSSYTIPRAGAITVMQFKSRYGFPLLIHIISNHGKSIVSLGDEITDINGAVLGYVGQGGVLYARVPTEIGRLIIKGHAISGKGNVCIINYDLKTENKDSALIRKEYQCQ